MKQEDVTLTQVREAAQKYATSTQTNGNYSCSHACMYTYLNGSHCIAGQILSDIGVEIPGYGAEHNGSAVKGAFPYLNQEVTAYLNRAQVKADQLLSWSEAVAHAERFINE